MNVAWEASKTFTAAQTQGTKVGEILDVLRNVSEVCTIPKIYFLKIWDF